MHALRLVAVSLLVSVCATNSYAADRRYELHFTAVSCVVSPCPDWQVVDIATGEKFNAVVDFSQLARPPSSSNDLIAEGLRTKLQRPAGDGSYERLVVSAIIKATPSIPGYRP